MEELVDAIKEGQIITIPASQARSEDLFILRHRSESPSSQVATAAPVSFSARRKERENDPTLYKNASKWHSYEPEYKKNNVIKDLVENFHWDIARGRKLKNLSRAQLAQAANVPENSIRMLEHGELPSDDFVLISKVERVLGIKLRTGSSQPSPGLGAPSTPQTQEISLAALQRRKEERASKEKSIAPKPSSSSPLSGSDIEIID